MSEDWIYVIPTKPDFVPHEHARVEARELFEQFVYPPGFEDRLLHEIIDEVFDAIEFIPGGGLDNVKCPRCGRSVIDPWWGEAMTAAYETHFHRFTAIVPCCQVPYALHDLVYVPPSGFARYRLGALYPNIYELTPSQLDTLADVLGCHIRHLWRHI